VINALMRWCVLAVAVWVAAHIVPGIRYDNWQSLLIAALVLGLMNTFVKPVLRVLSLPFIILTMGLFLPVINALVLLLTAWIVPHFHVGGFWSAVGGGVVISLVGILLGFSGAKRRRIVVQETVFEHRGPPPGKGPIIDV
jgi:putative membrane protein